MCDLEETRDPQLPLLTRCGVCRGRCGPGLLTFGFVAYLLYCLLDLFSKPVFHFIRFGHLKI